MQNEIAKRSKRKKTDLLNSAAKKAYKLKRGASWKQYVDLFFIIKNHFTITEISQRAVEMYGTWFSPKLFRMQLVYFDGIDYSIKVTYKTPNPPTEEEIKSFLTDVSLTM